MVTPADSPGSASKYCTLGGTAASGIRAVWPNAAGVSEG
jgi:hypothetical protein